MDSSVVVKSRKPKFNLNNHFKKYWQLWLMVLPGVLVVLIFNYIPMYGVQLAFRDFDFSKGLSGGQFVGLKYFRQFFEGPMFGELMINTIRISLATVVFGFIAPIMLALIINQIGNARAKRVLETTVYLPHFISVVVMVGMIQIFLTPSTGILTHLFHLGGSVNLLGETSTFVPVYVISEIWQHCGWNSIIYLAALSGVDPQLYESAEMDGANRFQKIWHVDIPAIVPTMALLLILNMGGILGAGFDKIYLMQNNLNLPVSEVISTYVYKIGMLGSQFSYSTAIGLFNNLVNFAFLMITNIISKHVAHQSLF